MKDLKRTDNESLSLIVSPKMNAMEKGETIFNPVLFENICRRLEKLQPDAKALWGKLNCTQMLNHLKVSTGSGMVIYRLKDESSFVYRNLIKYLVLCILNRLPKKASAPSGFSIEMNYDLDFNTEKNMALDIVAMAHESNFLKYPHPLFGEMSKAHWGRLVYRHYDHHLRQFGF